MNMETRKIIISGIVQGIGFRPYVYNLAKQNSLTGYVYNDSSGVTIVIQGSPADLDNFENSLKYNPSARSKIVTYQSLIIDQDEVFDKFEIHQSPASGAKTAAISPDLDVCDECLRELFDPGNRRYLYPFINCTKCGPRYTIVQDIPYDRPKTTMREFQMCSDCQAEYDDPANRRFHAQPNACPVCGPHLELRNASGQVFVSACESEEYENLFKYISQLFHDGSILAIKGIGGFHLACDARNETAVLTLRSRKYREDKPFAVMFPNIAEIEKICHVNNYEKESLRSVEYPIVLLRKKTAYDLADSVAPNNHFLGAMLPYTPLHHVIFHDYEEPLVMTSGNISDEPIAYINDDATRRLGNIADYFLVHNRDIHIRCDDSVMRIFEKKPYPIRRSRGYTPDKMMINWQFDQHILACGPEQKNTFALAKDNSIYLSHHIGDMENLEVLKSMEEGIKHFQHVFDIYPELVAYDLHPDYLSTKFALEHSKKNNIQASGIQHHHAHAVSCMVENQIQNPVLGIILDGTGYGIDGNIWGGELLLAEYHQFERLGHFRSTRLPGGTAAIKNPWQMGISYLYKVFGESLVDIPFLEKLDDDKIRMILKILETGFNSPTTSSCGRLFDGVAAIAGLRNSVNYEGQAAVEFEQTISEDRDGHYPFEILDSDAQLILDWEPMIYPLIEDIRNRISISGISQKFHDGLADSLVNWALAARQQTQINQIVLSGGVFMNIYLLTRLKKALENKGFIVYTHSVVPCNDGGISLGQAVIASAQVKL